MQPSQYSYDIFAACVEPANWHFKGHKTFTSRCCVFILNVEPGHTTIPILRDLFVSSPQHPPAEVPSQGLVTAAVRALLEVVSADSGSQPKGAKASNSKASGSKVSCYMT